MFTVLYYQKLEEYKLSVVRRYNCSPDTLEQEIQGGCQVIIVVNAEKLYGTDAEMKAPILYGISH